MKLLLEPKRLSRRVAKALGDPRNELWLSPVSAWAMALAPLHEALLTHEVALATQAVQLPHRDPADRFLAATAKVYGLSLVTADENFARSKDFSVVMNR